MPRGAGEGRPSIEAHEGFPTHDGVVGKPAANTRWVQPVTMRSFPSYPGWRLALQPHWAAQVLPIQDLMWLCTAQLALWEALGCTSSAATSYSTWAAQATQPATANSTAASLGVLAGLRPGSHIRQHLSGPGPTAHKCAQHSCLTGGPGSHPAPRAPRAHPAGTATHRRKGAAAAPWRSRSVPAGAQGGLQSKRVVFTEMCGPLMDNDVLSIQSTRKACTNALVLLRDAAKALHPCPA